MRSLNFSHLRYFWAVAHDGNLTRTAARLNVSQSALSVQIRRLEERLGHRLFDRVGRHLALTDAGRLALEHADAIFLAGDELVRALGDGARERRILRVGALGTLSRNLQLRFLRPVLGRDDVEVVLRSGGAIELFEALRSLELDAVLTNMPPVAQWSTPYVLHRLAEQQVGLVGTPALIAGERDPAVLLATRPLIVPTAATSTRAALDGLLAAMGVRPLVAAEVDDAAMMRLLARDGAGLAILPPIVVGDELAAGTLVEAAALPGLTETFYAVTVERRFPSELLQGLLRAAGSG